ncbi:MAG: hypothetical protein IKT09_01400 [Synergistes sp.]|nr:hypothetical protein [Synergistes sp.]
MVSEKFSIIGDGLVLVDHGPVTMTLEARKRGRPFTEGAVEGAKRALEVFDGIAAHLDFIRTPFSGIRSIPEGAPAAVRRMAESVAQLEDGSFTPLAAVAGTTADFAVSAMAAAGADLAFANNGGDIAWHVLRGEKDFINVGMISDLSIGRATHSLKICAFDDIRGLATSGLGGRSLTRGIASAVTVLAADSSKADAAATAIANACYCDDPAIERCLAEELDYGTDIRGLTVTRSVGALRKESIRTALAAGTEKAKVLTEKGMIAGAVLFVCGAMSIVKQRDRGNLFEVAEL